MDPLLWKLMLIVYIKFDFLPNVFLIKLKWNQMIKNCVFVNPGFSVDSADGLITGMYTVQGFTYPLVGTLLECTFYGVLVC